MTYACVGRCLRAWLFHALLAYVAAAFLLPKGAGSAIVFYAAVVPCLAARLAERPRLPWRDPGFALAVALIVWSALTLAWGEGGWQRAGQFFADAAATLLFLLAMVLTLDEPAARDRLARLLVVLGAVNAGFAICLAFALHPHVARIHGWGDTSHPILGAMVMQTAYITALARGLGRQEGRAANLAAASVMGLFIALTESRGPLLGSAVATVLLVGLSPWRSWLLAAPVGLALAYALPLRFVRHGIAVILQRGTSHRLVVWRESLDLAGQRPLLGHGLGAKMHLQVADVLITFPHDLYLSLLYYSGAVGLALFIGLAAVLARRLSRRWYGEAPWLAALGAGVLGGGLTDLGQVTKGPGTMWLILWVPAGLMLGWWRDQAAARPARAAAAPPALRT